MDFLNDGRPGRWRPTESKGPRWARALEVELLQARCATLRALSTPDVPAAVRRRLDRLASDLSGVQLVAELFARGDLLSGGDLGGEGVARG